jgi:hypothetical protein
MFANLNCHDLDAFIMARQDRDNPEFTAKNKIPKKGSISEALLGVRNKILIAFECRQIKNLIGENVPYNADIANDVSVEDHLGVFTVLLGEGDCVLPSRLLSDEHWVGFVVSLLNLEDLNVTNTITTQQKIKADHLVKILQHRFQQHLIHCIKNKCRRTHWSMIFAYNNLAVSVACVVMCDHAASELRCLQDSDCLLSPTPYNFFQCAHFRTREGAYLYYDTNKGCFIHSVKVTRRGFTVRGKEHFDKSKKVKSSTHFYYLYSSNLCPRANKTGTKGTFENLQMIIAAGWDPTSDCAKMLDSSWENRGLMIFNEKKVHR